MLKSKVAQFQAGISDELVEQVAVVLKALSTPIRLRIVCELCTSEKSVSELIAVAGVRQTSVSQKLASLRKQGIITCRKEGAKVIYRIADQNVAQIIQGLCQIYKG